MKSVFKFVAVALVAVVVLLTVAAIALPLLFDPNDYRDDLVQRVEEATGRDLQIQGDIAMSVFPWLGLELGPMQLGNAPGFEGDNFASTERISVRIKLVPLLSRRLEADTIIVEGLQLNLARDAKGLTNWADLAGDLGGRKSTTGGGEAVDEEGSVVSLAALTVGGVSVEDGKVTWRDAQSDLALVLSDVGLKTGRVEQGRPVNVQFGMNVTAESLDIAGRVGVETTLTLDLAGAKLSLSPVTLKASLAGAAVPGAKADVTVGAVGIQYDAKAHSAAFNGLEARLHNLALSADLKATGLNAAPLVTGNLQAVEFSLRELLGALAIEVPPTADPKVLEKVAFGAKVRAGPGSLTLSDLQAVLDDSTLRGKFAVPAFVGPTLRFDLVLDQLDADRYLPPDSKTAPRGQAGEAPANPEKPDFRALRKLDAAGKFKLGRLKIANLTTTQASVEIVAKNGLVRIDPAAAQLYGGAYAGKISFDARKDVSIIKVDESLKGIEAEPLLKDLNGQDRLAGTGNVDAKLTTAGLDINAMKAALSGTVKFSFENGAVRGVNIGRLIREAKAKLKGRQLPPDKEQLQTDFSEMSGSIRFKKGVGHNKDFVAKSPLLRVKGHGSADLNAETMNYRIEARVVGTAKGQGGADLKELSGVTIPVRVGGTFAEPTYGLDVAALAKVLAKSKAAGIVGGDKAEVLDKLKKSGSGGVKSLLKGLLGN